jgi:DNA-binding transcriptional ArsR family regulator
LSEAVGTAGALPVEDVFGVIAHPIRRELLVRLAGGDRCVADLAEGLPVSRPAVSQHLRLMLGLSVVGERRKGRERWYRLEPDALGDVRAWLDDLDTFWATRLDALGAYLDGSS